MTDPTIPSIRRNLVRGVVHSALPPLEEAYFTWLQSFVESIAQRDVNFSHTKLLRILHSTPFEFFVPNDENRALDGKFLRERFLQSGEYVYDQYWFDLDCSMLEMLIALAERADFETDPQADPGGVSGWFWLMLSNVGLDDCTDAVFREARSRSGGTTAIEGEIHTTLFIINQRIYMPDGDGGLFPLSGSGRDQRSLELWVQLSDYLLAGGYVQISGEEC